MRIIQETINSTFYDSPIFSEYFGGMKIVVADIETTGLSPAKCSVILGGALSADGNGGLSAVQFFGDIEKDEPELLQRYTDYLAMFDIVVTYNGQRFDLPFLRKRMKANGLDPSKLDCLYSLDMYQVIKKHSHLSGLLPNLKQKTVEIYLGESSDRTDEIDGAESVRLYYEYVNSKGARKGEILDTILLHNRDDIVRLGSILKILRTLDLHEIAFYRGFPVAFSEMTLFVEKMGFSGNVLKAEGRAAGNVSEYMCYEDGFQLEVDSKHREFEMKVSCEDVSGFTVADAVSLGVDTPQIREVGGYESGYLILRNEKKVNFHEVNLLVRNLLYRALQ